MLAVACTPARPSPSCTAPAPTPSGCSSSSARRNFPRTRGLPPEHRHAIHVDEIDLLVESDEAPLALPDAEPTDVDRAIAEHARTFIPDGATLQTGIGAVPSTIAALLADGPGGGYGLHTEMFTTGCMRLHQAGKVTNDKALYPGVSVTTFAAGSAELYEWLDGNEEVAFLPVELVNTPELIARNESMVTINAAHVGRHPRAGRRGHDRRRPVLRRRRPRGLRLRPGPVADRPLAALPAVHLHGQGRDGPLAHRAVLRGGRRHHHPAPPGRRRRHGARQPPS